MGGQDKGLIEFEGQPIVKILIDKLQQQQLNVVINANRNLDVYQEFDVPIISDELEDFQGPLAGFAVTMKSVDTQYILTLPCDGPFLADDFVERFIRTASKTGAAICVADDGDRLQPVYALIRSDLLDSLEQYLQAGDRKIDRWYTQHDFAKVDFSSQKNMFGNINKPEDHRVLLEQYNQ